MKIEKNSKPLPTITPGEERARAPTASPVSSTQSTVTSVHLGATSAQLQKMESSMANTPLVDAAKVADIKQAISEGRFQVNSSAVADGLIQTVQDLISSHKT
ncbi:flagellar biosynthesis anti-sigma factor FlgM [Candidatus Nitrotoga sp. AM1P]|uniref:flagellar biosynthesis anti-sigma factor FlgM n=1 Tax=Candidatus Nitrotoga sp. AM1P TaxID=2559597 RepID=UPI0010B0A780|nr:flagellar biosynthesis anti-sigma factor FlgM [Candidatus Nitrotoga sp. AM1P]BBJ22179.1 anti-sigma 28 factor FlgM [Candidatus Nitrotoga sp. AM1P]